MQKRASYESFKNHRITCNQNTPKQKSRNIVHRKKYQQVHSYTNPCTNHSAFPADPARNKSINKTYHKNC